MLGRRHARRVDRNLISNKTSNAARHCYNGDLPVVIRPSRSLGKRCFQTHDVATRASSPSLTFESCTSRERKNRRVFRERRDEEERRDGCLKSDRWSHNRFRRISSSYKTRRYAIICVQFIFSRVIILNHRLVYLFRREVRKREGILQEPSSLLTSRALL